MAWTIPKTWNVAEKVTAALMNLHLRDNLSYLKGLLDGTGSDIVKVPSSLWIRNDSGFRLDLIGGFNGLLLSAVSSSSWLDYDSTNLRMRFIIQGGLKWFVDSNGKQGGSGFFSSSLTSVASGGAVVNITHGFASQPRFVFGYYNTAASGGTRVLFCGKDIGATAVGITDVSSSQITIQNNSGGTAWVTVHAMQ